MKFKITGKLRNRLGIETQFAKHCLYNTLLFNKPTTLSGSGPINAYIVRGNIYPKKSTKIVFDGNQIFDGHKAESTTEQFRKVLSAVITKNGACGNIFRIDCKLPKFKNFENDSFTHGIIKIELKEIYIDKLEEVIGLFRLLQIL